MIEQHLETVDYEGSDDNKSEIDNDDIKMDDNDHQNKSKKNNNISNDSQLQKYLFESKSISNNININSENENNQKIEEQNISGNTKNPKEEKETTQPFENQKYILKNSLNSSNELGVIVKVSKRKENNPNPILNKSDNKEFIPRPLTKLSIDYINPVLYFLGGIDEFIDYFIENTMKYKKNVEQNGKSFLSFVTSRFYYHMFMDKKKTVYNSNNYLTVLKNMFKSIEKEKNMNPNEVLFFILNKLHDEILENKNEKLEYPEYNRYDMNEVINTEVNIYNKNKSIITETLNFWQIKTYNCNECNNRFYEAKNYLTFHLNIAELSEKNHIKEKNNITLQDCLKEEFNKNNIKFLCEKCSSYQSFNISYKFYEIGKKIIFILDRDNSDNISFIVEEKFDFKNYLNKAKNNTPYELCGIISKENHRDKLFVAFIKSHINKKWYLYMDEKVEEKKDINEVLNNNNNGKYIPYTLMYSQIRDN